MTKEEAEKEAQRKNAEPVTKLCPLVKNYCDKDCVCYREAGVFKNRWYENEYEVSEPGCSNAMFFNECRCL